MKRYNVDKQVLKDMVYGCLKELGENSSVYYHSKFGEKYSHFTEKGEKAVVAILQDFVHRILETEEQEYQERKKQDTFDALKGSSEKSD